MITADTVIIGGGIVGLTIARELLKRGHKKIVILEKEKQIAQHASGRNSGVLHAGIYYPPHTLKAKFCLEGGKRMKAYCAEHDLPMDPCGKVIVTRDETELNTLKELYERATTNGAKVDLIDEKQLAEYEPHARTTQQALYSHYTAVVDPKQVMATMYKELSEHQDVDIYLDTPFETLDEGKYIKTNKGRIEYGLCINAAGAYADKIAHQFNVGKQYSLMPFKGIYKKVKKEHAELCRGNIYPVPNINNPFLGVHFTRSIHGDVYVGPTAIPAFGRENYAIIKDADMEGLKFLWQDAILFASNKKFRQVALTEPKKYMNSYFFNDAKKLVKHIEPSWLEDSPKVGIRPQLIDWRTKELVMDFLIEKEGNSLHILNAISPAFTCSLAFSEYVVDNYIQN